MQSIDGCNFDMPILSLKFVFLISEHVQVTPGLSM